MSSGRSGPSQNSGPGIPKRALPVVAVLLALSLAPSELSAQSAALAAAPEKLDITAESIESFEPREASKRIFGSLEFRGGLELRSPHKGFGGLSGLRILPDGATFIAVTDKAFWLRGRIVYRGERPVGIADAELAPMLGANGRPLSERGWYDTEALAADDAGNLYVGIERSNRIVRFNYGKEGLLARGQPVPVPNGVTALPYNRGIECVAIAPKSPPLAGALIALSERGLDASKNIRGFLIGGRMPGDFTLKSSDEFGVTDCAVTPANDLLVLERYFTWRQGVSIRLRSVPLSALSPGAVVDGSVLLEADMGFQIDNMEGLSVHRAPDGATVLTLVSDDNFSILQRTLLLQFALRSK